jgi:hypothetical protein
MSEGRFKLHYRGSLLLLIFWFIVFFPIALALLLTASTFQFNQTTYNLQYDGSRFWLCFWVLFFFPIAFILLFINGFSASVQKPGEVPCCKTPKNTE